MESKIKYKEINFLIRAFRRQAAIDLWPPVVQWLAASRPRSVAVYNDDVAVLSTSNAGSGFAENSESSAQRFFWGTFPKNEELRQQTRTSKSLSK